MHAPRLRVRVAATFQKRSREEKRQCATVKNFAENSHFQPQIFLLIRRSRAIICLLAAACAPRRWATHSLTEQVPTA